MSRRGGEEEQKGSRWGADNEQRRRRGGADGEWKSKFCLFPVTSQLSAFIPLLRK